MSGWKQSQKSTEALFDEFWRDLVCNPDGTLNEEAVKNELADFHFLLEQVPEVYCEVTGDVLSKTSYYASSVIEVYREHVERQIEQAIEDFKEENCEACRGGNDA